MITKALTIISLMMENDKSDKMIMMTTVVTKTIATMINYHGNDTDNGK